MPSCAASPITRAPSFPCTAAPPLPRRPFPLRPVRAPRRLCCGRPLSARSTRPCSSMPSAASPCPSHALSTSDASTGAPPPESPSQQPPPPPPRYLHPLPQCRARRTPPVCLRLCEHHTPLASLPPGPQSPPTPDPDPNARRRIERRNRLRAAWASALASPPADALRRKLEAARRIRPGVKSVRAPNPPSLPQHLRPRPRLGRARQDARGRRMQRTRLPEIPSPQPFTPAPRPCPRAHVPTLLCPFRRLRCTNGTSSCRRHSPPMRPPLRRRSMTLTGSWWRSTRAAELKRTDHGRTISKGRPMCQT